MKSESGGYTIMMTRRDGIQQKISIVTLDALMPKDHYLRDVDRLVDFSFIYDLMTPLYSSVGAPSLDPVLVIKMLLLGFMEGIDSERKLCEQVRLNIAYRWFLGLDFDDPTPEHSAFSQLRRRKWKNTCIFEEIFAGIVKQCIDYGLISGKLLMTDSTHVRANADNQRVLRVYVDEDTPSAYLNRLNERAKWEGIYPQRRENKADEPVPTPKEEYKAAAGRDEEWMQKTEEAMEAGKDPKDVKREVPKGKKEVLRSITDPDAGFMKRFGKPLGFYYLSHQTTDALFGLVTDVYVTPGNATDDSVYAKRILHQIREYGFTPFGVCADTGYDYSEIHHDMLVRGIHTYIPKRKRIHESEERFSVEDFQYDRKNEICICPNGKELEFVGGYNPDKGSKRYTSTKRQCQGCPYREKCLTGKLGIRRVDRQYDRWAMEEQHARNDGTSMYRYALRRRKILSEGNFALQKSGHNLTRMRKRGLGNGFEHCLLSASALDVRRMVRILTGRNRTPQKPIAAAVA